VSRTLRRRFRRRVFIACALACAAALAAVLAFRAAVAWMPYPSDAVAAIEPCTWIEDRDGNCLGAFAAASGQWSLPLREDQISPHLLKAIVAIEDRRFYGHDGVDWESAAGAAAEDLLSRSPRRGASTITMQLYRLGHPSRRSVWAKVIQAVRAEQIERRLSKRAILTNYLNAAPFGANLVGAGAASWRYFGRPCGDLSLGEAALLAGLPQNPNGYRPDRFPQRAKVRRNRVLDDMLALGMIDRKQHDQAQAEPVEAKWHSLPQDASNDGIAGTQNPLALWPFLTELAQRNPGRTIRTSIDPKIQRQTAAQAADALGRLAPSHVTAAAVVVLDTQTAQCLASVSLSLDRGSEAIDLANRPRSSGSTLKPFIYAAAFDAGICTPQSIVSDSPTVWAGYAPQDYDRDFAGPMLAADALAQSRNVPAMALLSKVGVERAVGVMSAMGLATLARNPMQYGLPLAIGGADVTPMELAEAYATLGREGEHRRATTVLPADSHSEPSHIRLALRPKSCRAVLYCLADPDRTQRICPSAAALSPAWKTGTSSGHRDAWCAAVTPRRTVVVWLGNADGAGSDALVGQDSAAPLALKILTANDPGGAGFSPPAGFHADAQSASVEFSADAGGDPALIFPVNGQEIVRDPSLPANRQRLALRARVPDGGQLWWFVDGQLAGGCASGQPVWWQPTSGEHEILVVTDNGQAARAEIRVR